MSNKRARKDKDRIAEDAAGWVARLQSSDATEEDHKQFAEWLALDPAHREAHGMYRRLWGELRDVPIPSDRLKKLARTRRRTAAARATGFAVVAFVFLSMHQIGLLDRLRADHSTSVGEVRMVALEDGTQVDLNTDTAISVSFSEKARRVTVLRGEAFFDVAKNPARPFTVEGGTISAVAVGTRYSVHSATGGFHGDIQVEEGRVDVRTGSERVTVDAGHEATLNAEGKVTVRPADVGSTTAWRTGKLVFSNRPLRDVLATLERYRKGRIFILDEAAAGSRVSGIFDLTDTEEALREIETTLPVTVTRLTGLMVIVRSRTP
ncbi:FecR family protein [Rhodomicrobium vannielii ATCC 17100]|uniref:FecR family protein n=1 Tax=Rhodomicrobium vannielii TaxID=1069 RepID=UPI00191916A2|nr:FecR family protein [Rhodomicrobium vannielii]MBJ7532722.1 FecR family protein [Rhodomicrobium vannielii ATCC 17100]